MKGKRLFSRVISVMLIVMVGLVFSFEITKSDASALSTPKQVKSLTVKHDSTYPDAALLKWKKVSNATGYKVYRSTKKTKGFKCIATLKGKSKTKYVDGSFALSCDGKTWYYKVRAYKKKGSKTKYGKYSKVKSFKNPKVAVSFDLYNCTYVDGDDPFYALDVAVDNGTSGAILMSDWLGANDKCYYDAAGVWNWNTEEFEVIDDQTDLIVMAGGYEDYLFIADPDSYAAFTDADWDWFDWYFLTEGTYLNRDSFYGDWYQYKTKVYVDASSNGLTKGGVKKLEPKEKKRGSVVAPEALEKYNTLFKDKAGDKVKTK